MEQLEAREERIRRHIVGRTLSTPGVVNKSVVERMNELNTQLEQLNATITGFGKLTLMCMWKILGLV